MERGQRAEPVSSRLDYDEDILELYESFRAMVLLVEVQRLSARCLWITTYAECGNNLAQPGDLNGTPFVNRLPS